MLYLAFIIESSLAMCALCACLRVFAAAALVLLPKTVMMIMPLSSKESFQQLMPLLWLKGALEIYGD